MKHSSFFTLIIILLSIIGCAQFKYMADSETSRSYIITRSSYDNAYSKAVKAANECGLSILTSDKSSGVFYATKGDPYREFSQLNFSLSKDGKALNCIVKIKSSDNDKITKSFISNYSKYVSLKEVSAIP